MRISTGQVFFAAPDTLSDYRITDDTLRFTRLLNEKFLSSEDFSFYKATMTSGGVRDWLIKASSGQTDCALKILSESFGKQRDNCGACHFCRLISTTNVQFEAARRIEQERKNEQSTQRVLMKLALVGLACKISQIVVEYPCLMERAANHFPKIDLAAFLGRTVINVGSVNMTARRSVSTKGT